MMRAVRLRLRTSLLVVARAKTLKAGRAQSNRMSDCLGENKLLLEKPSIPKVIRIIETPEFLFSPQQRFAKEVRPSQQ